MSSSYINMPSVQFKKMSVIKRDQSIQQVSFDKIIQRIDSLCWGLDSTYIDPIDIAKDTIKLMYNGITTEEIDQISADVCANQIMKHPDFNKLAARIIVSNLHKNTEKDFLTTIEKLYHNYVKDGSIESEDRHAPIVSLELLEYVKTNKEEIQKKINYDRDYNFSFFGIKTLERAYLGRTVHYKEVNMDSSEDNKIKGKDLTINNKKYKEYFQIVERPQHLYMRVALAIHKDNLEKAFETYDLLSEHYFTHASPTLFNAGTNKQQLSSCFLLNMEDSLEGMYDTIKETALISKDAGGIGITIGNIRGNGSIIRGTNKPSDGTVPLCSVLNSIGRHVNQGGRRKGAIAIYFEPWHMDIEDLIALRRPTGNEDSKARDLFLGLWVPDLFMKRVQNNEVWSLMCPDKCPGLTTSYGEEFEKLYEKYESQGRFTKQLKARDLWEEILVAQIESGMPYMCYKDNVNKKSNQKNVGTIQQSNLCSEIVEFSSKDETAVCNLASISLPKFIEVNDKGEKYYNFEKLRNIARVATANLNKIIDINYYPSDKAKRSNFRHRPIGIGAQGLADVFNRFGYSFESKEASKLNKQIFETIYYGAIEESNRLAKEDGHYETFEGSPFSEGKFQFNLWGIDESELMWDWKSLRQSVMEYGVRNSLLTALMPTASTSQIMSNNECIEPYTSNMYVRNTLAGEYLVMNENLVNDLLKLNLWTEDIRKEILYDNGSIQNISEIPKYLKDVYKTAFELSQKALLERAVERGAFVDQAESHNNHMAQPNFKDLTRIHMYGWSNGLKTGQYYLRLKTAVNADKFSLDSEDIQRIKRKKGYLNISENEEKEPEMVMPKKVNRFARPEDLETCEMCSS